MTDRLDAIRTSHETDGVPMLYEDEAWLLSVVEAADELVEAVKGRDMKDIVDWFQDVRRTTDAYLRIREGKTE